MPDPSRGAAALAWGMAAPTAAAPATGAPGAGRGMRWGDAAAATSLLPAVRPALGAPPGRRALLLPPLPPRPRRAAWLLARDAARGSGGTVVEAASGEMLLLLGAADGAERRVREGLAALEVPVAAAWHLPEDGHALLAWAQAARPAAAPTSPGPPTPPLERVVVRRSLWRLAPSASPVRMGWRLAVSQAALHGPAGPGPAPEALDAAAAGIARRLLEEPAAWPGLGLSGAGVGLTLLPVPPDLPPLPPPVAGAIAVLPLAAAATPRAFAAAEARLRGSGWGGLALAGLSAALLDLLAPAALPDAARLLLLRWSPGLAGRAGTAALRPLDPDRLVLTGCDAAGEAIGWGLSIGLTRFAGRELEAAAPGLAPG